MIYALLLLGLVPMLLIPDFRTDGPGLDEDDDVPPNENGGGFGPDMDEDDSGDDAPEDTGGEPDPLTPIDEDDTASGNNDGAGDALAPLDEDDTASGNTDGEEDALDPVDDIDSTSEEFWVQGSDAGTTVAEIEGFDPGTDVLHVTVDPDRVTPPLELEVTPSADGTDAEVYLADQLLAILRGAPDAGTADIVVEFRRLS